jgi:hypothetical protein
MPQRPRRLRLRSSPHLGHLLYCYQLAIPGQMRSTTEKRRQDRKFRSTIQSTKRVVLHDFGGLRRSPRVCKSLKNLKICHGRGRGFEPRRPRHRFQTIYLELVETREGAKGHRFVPLLCPFAVNTADIDDG